MHLVQDRNLWQDLENTGNEPLDSIKGGGFLD